MFSGRDLLITLGYYYTQGFRSFFLKIIKSICKIQYFLIVLACVHKSVVTNMDMKNDCISN